MMGVRFPLPAFKTLIKYEQINNICIKLNCFESMSKIESVGGLNQTTISFLFIGREGNRTPDTVVRSHVL